MEKEKKDFVNAILDFVNIEDVAKLTDRECKKTAREMVRLAGVADHVLFAIREDKRTSGYSGGVLSQRGIDLEEAGKPREFLKTLHFRLGLVFADYFNGKLAEDFGKINYSLILEKEFRLAITPEVTSSPDVVKILMGLAWALHGVPGDRIKKCAYCGCRPGKDGKLFFQSTATNKTSCSKACADKLVDKNRRGTDKRKETVRRSSIKQYAERVRSNGGRGIPVAVEGRKKRLWK